MINMTEFSTHTERNTPVFEEKINAHEDGSGEFANIALGEHPAKKKVPRRIIHFSDGTMEEYSTDEEEDEPDIRPQVDPKALDWLPWIWYYMVMVSLKSLNAADFCGEKLAWFFGITSPKYQHAIDEFNRLKREDQEEKDRDLREQLAETDRKTNQLAEMEACSVQSSCDRTFGE